MTGQLQHKGITTIAALKQGLEDVWRAVPPQLLVNLADSMQRRLELVVRREGEYTGY